ncbi:NADPH:adrenodoxin oxidoreductase, mitochondrial-like [Sycon ciliatum]|uniref:NADPH:adrenodoxin oxidoreductase, mitochondrial-like n=1 Tax=Sycon ciliatum TaxID=27933 RepID=UPI0031F61356
MKYASQSVDMNFPGLSCGLRRCGRAAWRVKAVNQRLLHVCVVGSGPAGFYTAQHLLKKGSPDVNVDIVDKLPVPFGLVRYGVAPHHQDVKNVTNQFTELAKSERCTFLGNVCVGDDITIASLRRLYDVVVLAYGASEDRKLGVPGEDLAGVVSARDFVGWYNGLPEHRELSIDLSSETAVIFGLGNVAMDVAMMLLSPISFLEKTDISEHALEQLRKSNVKKVYLVGRRGPLQAAFTIKECRELIRLADCRPRFSTADFEHLTEQEMAKLERPRKRLTKLLHDTAMIAPSESEQQRRNQAAKEFEMLFCRSPVEVVADVDGAKASGVKLEVNRIQDGKAVATGEFETLNCGLVFRSIGYRGVGLDPESDELLQFDERSGVVPNNSGRTQCPGVYCSGWIKHGPSGTIVDTLQDALETADTILYDINQKKDGISSEHGTSTDHESAPNTSTASDSLLKMMEQKGVQVVTFSDWERINAVEVERGQVIGKPREKVVDVDEMLAIARGAADR